MAEIIALFAVRLICGMGIMLGVMPRQQVATAYFRIMMLVTLGLSVVLALVLPGERWIGAGLGAIAFIGSVCWLLERKRAGTIAIGLIVALSLWELIRLSLPGSDAAAPSAATWLGPLSALASAGTLGAAMTGMLLGHRYLTAPGMPLAPLVRMNQALGAATLVRLVLSAGALTLGTAGLTDTVYWVWLGLRWLAGILGPGVACLMVQRILRYRNTQAATGVLFVAVILTFIGELTANLLQRATHIPY